MRKPTNVQGLTILGRVRLSKSFFMREFVFSGIAATNGLPNVPDNPDLAITTGKRLCEDLLEPLQAVPLANNCGRLTTWDDDGGDWQPDAGDTASIIGLEARVESLRSSFDPLDVRSIRPVG